MSEDLSPELRALWEQYKATMQEAHMQGMQQLLQHKNTVEIILLEGGQRLLVAYDKETNTESDK